jgi:hypothetical protein
VTDYSDTPAGAISRLDASIARRGQTVTIIKASGSPSVTVKAHVRPIRAEQIAGDSAITQAFCNVILSPTGLDAVLPLRKGDKCTIDGRQRQIEFPKPLTEADVLVRIELLVGG